MATAASDVPLSGASSSRTTAFPVTRSATQTSTLPSLDGIRRTAATAPTLRAACSSGARDGEPSSGGLSTMTSSAQALELRAHAPRERRVRLRGDDRDERRAARLSARAMIGVDQGGRRRWRSRRRASLPALLMGSGEDTPRQRRVRAVRVPSKVARRGVASAAIVAGARARLDEPARRLARERSARLLAEVRVEPARRLARRRRASELVRGDRRALRPREPPPARHERLRARCRGDRRGARPARGAAARRTTRLAARTPARRSSRPRRPRRSRPSRRA